MNNKSEKFFSIFSILGGIISIFITLTEVSFSISFLNKVKNDEILSSILFNFIYIISFFVLLVILYYKKIISNKKGIYLSLISVIIFLLLIIYLLIF